MALPHEVLLVYNIPLGRGLMERFSESEGSVLDQVEYAVAGLEELGLGHQTLGVEDLGELERVLESSREPAVINLVESIGADPTAHAAVPDLCRRFGREATGAGTDCLRRTQDKWAVKLALEGAGVRTPRACPASAGEALELGELVGLPLIVKPRLTHGSEGIFPDSVVRSPAALARALERVHRELAQAALVEEMIGERELTVSLLEESGEVGVLAVSEIDYRDFGAGRPHITDYTAKWHPESFEYIHTQRLVPAPIGPALEAEVRAMARAAWHALGCQDYARVDLRLDADERPYVIDVNPNPDFSATTGYDEALQHRGRGIRHFLEAILANALTRMLDQDRPGLDECSVA